MNAIRRFFNSCAGRQFRSYREALRQLLTTSINEVKIKEDFTTGGSKLLEKLDDYIAHASAVLHLIGKWAGKTAKSVEVRAILDTCEDAADKTRRWVEAHLFGLVRRYDGLRLVVAGEQVPRLESAARWACLAIRRELPLITDPDHWCRYLRDVLRVTTYPDDHINRLVRAFQGSPRPLGTLLANLQKRGR